MIDFIGEVKDDYGVTHPERPRQAGHQVERRHRDAARDASDSATRPALRCCPASTSSSCSRATPRPDASARIRRRSSIPNLNRESKRVPISSVVLSSQRVPLGDALYTREAEGRGRVGRPARLRRAEAHSQRHARVQQGPRPATSSSRPTSAARRRCSRSWRSSASIAAT